MLGIDMCDRQTFLKSICSEEGRGDTSKGDDVIESA